MRVSLCGCTVDQALGRIEALLDQLEANSARQTETAILATAIADELDVDVGMLDEVLDHHRNDWRKTRSTLLAAIGRELAESARADSSR